MWNRLAVAYLSITMVACATTTPPASPSLTARRASSPARVASMRAPDALPPTRFASCGGADDSLHIKDLRMTPDPPVVGKPLTIKVTGILTREIAPGASLRLRAYAGIFKVKDETLDLCQNARLSCPLPADTPVITSTFEVPNNVPAGVTIDLEASAKNLDGTSLACLKGSVKFER